MFQYINCAYNRSFLTYYPAPNHTLTFLLWAGLTEINIKLTTAKDILFYEKKKKKKGKLSVNSSVIILYLNHPNLNIMFFFHKNIKKISCKGTSNPYIFNAPKYFENNLLFYA